jgi:predicted MFS family arabinose efflux permease
VEHLSWHWLFWLPLAVTVLAALATWRFIPESPIRSPGKVNWLAAGLMTLGISLVLIAIAQTTIWGWGASKTIALFIAGVIVCAFWVAVEVRSDEPLVDMSMMRIRGVWTTNLAAFLLGAGLYSSFIVYPEFAQLPKSTGFGFGASVVVSSLYLLPSAFGMGLLGTIAGRVARAYGSKFALVVGTAITAVSFLWLAVAHAHPWDMLVASTLLGIGIGLAFSALGNLIVQAVPSSQTGIASGMNTVMRTLGGALGGQLSATFIADHMTDGLPTVTGFTLSFIMAAAFLGVGVLAGLLVPGLPPLKRPSELDASPGLEIASEQSPS